MKQISLFNDLKNKKGSFIKKSKQPKTRKNNTHLHYQKKKQNKTTTLYEVMDPSFLDVQPTIYIFNVKQYVNPKTYHSNWINLDINIQYCRRKTRNETTTKQASNGQKG